MALETRPVHSVLHDTTVDGVRSKTAVAGVWLRRSEYTTERFWLPERPQIVRDDADLSPPPIASAQSASMVEDRPSRSLQCVDRRGAQGQQARALSRVSVRSGSGTTFRSVRTGPDPSVAERYSVDSASEARRQVVAMFGMLVGCLTLLVLLILIRSLAR